MSLRGGKLLFIPIIIAIIGFGYYALSPLWSTISLNEPVPEMVSTSTSTPLVAKPSVVDSSSSGDMGGPPLGPFPIVDTPLHPASGSVRIVVLPDGRRFVRFESYSTINGPDLHVYLAKGTDGKDFLDLGASKGTEGNINYEIPAGIDLSAYPYVLTWCVPFGVLFNYAHIIP